MVSRAYNIIKNYHKVNPCTGSVGGYGMAFANVTKAKIDKRKNNFYACGKMGRYAKKCPDKVKGQENTTKGMAVTVIYREKEVDGDLML